MKILGSLKDSQKCVSDICADTGEEQSKISHNLRVLIDCHIVDVKKDGRRRIYFLNQRTIIPLMDLIKNHVEYYCKECPNERSVSR